MNIEAASDPEPAPRIELTPRTEPVANIVGERPSGREWLREFAAALGLDAPTDAMVDSLLALAGTAAHASERIAAPIACFLVAQAGVDLARAQGIAESVGPSIESSPAGSSPAATNPGGKGP